MAAVRRSEDFPVPIWILTRTHPRHRMYKFDNPERQRESCVTVGCRNILEKAAKRNEVADFSDRGLVGGSLQRIWTDLAATYSQETAAELFACADLPHVRGVVTAVALVSIQHVPFGPLAILDPEERFYWEYYNRSPIVPLKIEHVCDLTGLGRNIHRAVVSSRNQPFFVKLHPGCVEELCRVDAVRTFFGEHGLDVAEIATEATLGACLWPPIAYLIAAKKWSFAALGGFQKRIPRFVPNAFREAWQFVSRLYAQDMAPPVQGDRDLHNPFGLRELAANIRQWGAYLLQQQEFDAEDQTFKLEAAIQLFEHKADTMEELRKEYWMESFGRHGFQRRFKMIQLLRLVVLVKDVRTATRTKQVLVSALRSVFPAEELGYLQQIVSDESIVPGKSVLYGMRFVVDMALMLHVRDRLRDSFGQVSGNDMEQPSVYLLVDSSPQGGKNLLNSEYDLITAADVLPLGDVFGEILELVRVLQTEDLEGPELQGFLGEHEAKLEQARSMIQHHCNIPVVLGSNHATLLHEYIALQHSLFMECGSSGTLANMNTCVVSVTTDRGTEKALVRVPPLRFDAAFPFFLPSEELRFEIDAGEQAGDPPEQPNRVGPHPEAVVDPGDLLSLQAAVDIAGPLHALGNASKGFVYTMPNYANLFYPQLNALIRFLHAPYYRELFTHTCLRDNLEVLQPLFRSFPHTIVQWRWLSLSAVVPQLLLRKNALIAGWNPQAMGIRVQRNNDAHGEEDAFHNMAWDLVDAAIQSPGFWAWLRMLSILTAVLGYLERWFFSCPCHCEAATMENLLRVVSAPLPDPNEQRHQERRLDKSCPFRKRRGPELASGDFLSMLDRLLAASNQEVVSVILADLTPQDRAKVVEDFEAAKQHLLFRMRVQFAVYTSLPRVLFGLGHKDQQQARRCASEALVQYQQYTPEQKQQAHALTKKFCDPEAQGGLRPLIIEFIAGASLRDLQRLRFHVLRIAWIPICEMSVERMHAVSKSVLTHGSHAASLPSLSLGNRWPEFLTAIQQPGRLQWFADTCAQVYHPLRACPVFGIVAHPDLATAFQGVEDINLLPVLGSTFKFSKTVKGIIYRSNHYLQFQDVSKCQKPPEEPKVEVARLPMPSADSVEERLLNIEAMHDFTDVLEPGCFYSVPIKLQRHDFCTELVVVPFMNRLNSCNQGDDQMPEWLQQECSIEQHPMEVDVAGFESSDNQVLPARQCLDADHMFFQVVSSRPARVKQDRATGIGFGADDIAVSRHVCLKMNCSGEHRSASAAESVQVEAMTAPGLVCQSAPFEKEEFDWILPRSQPSHIRHALTWDHDDCVACVVDKSFDLPAHVMDLLDRAIACKALPKTSFVIDEADCALDEISLFKQYDGALFTYIATLRLVCFSLQPYF